jgi:hypothetical protein
MLRFISVRFQSALVLCMVENRSKHCPGGGHAVVTDGMGVELQRQPDIAYGEAESARFLGSVLMRMRNDARL